MPTLFVSHGAPTFALEPDEAGQQLRQLGASLPRPKAVLVVSPHWPTPGVRVSATAAPETIHDFGGFSPALYEIRYPAAGHPGLAQRTAALLSTAGWQARVDPHRGLDHGAWVPLLHLLPQAEVPVYQVSMPRGLDEAGALRLGRALAPLADDGVLIVGSGSLTHNLYEFRLGGADDESYVMDFVRWVRAAVLAGDTDRLLRAVREAPHGRRAHPTTEHYLPLLVAVGAATPASATVFDGGIRHGVLAMESYAFERASTATRH